ncbi:MAG: L-seryl-tRNA(Sec) selenium transferase [Planctomycetes bacterium]|nr:L-seryl-tRNA(Sec) selenium transferase [Planctomycetota bacterium]
MSLLRKLPQVNAILESKEAAALATAHGRELVTEAVRGVIDGLREKIKAGENGMTEDSVSAPAILSRAAAVLAGSSKPGLRRVINATGIILHTGLGRAVMPKAALEALVAENRGYNLLEVDLETAERAHRERHVAKLVERLTGAPAATVVNNNAAATMLALAALAAGKEVIVSRGQLVEIGGAFRVPDVMKMSGCKMVEVGTTNKTRIADYEKAITPETALLLRVHRSNFAVVGFVEEPSLEELVELAKKHGIRVMDDIGSGALLDVARYGIAPEPMIAASIAQGADIACISGDKLLGGPQAGLIAGKADPVALCRRHPLFRAVRPDKLQLVALEATLRLYLNPDTVEENIPTLRMMKAGVQELEKRATVMARALVKAKIDAEVWDEESQIGGGSTPGQNLKTKVVAVDPGSVGADTLIVRLRRGEPPVFARVQKGRVLLDPRTMQDGEDEEAVAALRAILAKQE